MYCYTCSKFVQTMSTTPAIAIKFVSNDVICNVSGTLCWRFGVDLIGDNHVTTEQFSYER